MMLFKVVFMQEHFKNRIDDIHVPYSHTSFDATVPWVLFQSTFLYVSFHSSNCNCYLFVMIIDITY